MRCEESESTLRREYRTPRPPDALSGLRLAKLLNDMLGKMTPADFR